RQSMRLFNNDALWQAAERGNPRALQKAMRQTVALESVEVLGFIVIIIVWFYCKCSIHHILEVSKMQTQYVYRGSWFTLFRTLTLSGTISPILVATALSAMTGERDLHLGLFIGMLVAAICVQIATNIFNDYFDFANGQDQDKWTIQKSTEDKHGPLFKQLPFVAYEIGRASCRERV